MTDNRCQMSNKVFADALRSALGTTCLGLKSERDEMTLFAPREKIAYVLLALRDNAATAMGQLMDVCGVDYPDRKPRFDVVYQLLSLKLNRRLTVVVLADDGAPVPSVTAVHPAAGWFEREVFDLLGVEFTGHPDLRRLLTDYGFQGHPLRRDFPLSGFTEVRYDDLHRRVTTVPVSLQDPRRDFDTMSKWDGMTKVQQRQEEIET